MPDDKYIGTSGTETNGISSILFSLFRSPGEKQVINHGNLVTEEWSG